MPHPKWVIDFAHMYSFSTAFMHPQVQTLEFHFLTEEYKRIYLGQLYSLREKNVGVQLEFTNLDKFGGLPDTYDFLQKDPVFILSVEEKKDSETKTKKDRIKISVVVLCLSTPFKNLPPITETNILNEMVTTTLGALVNR